MSKTMFKIVDHPLVMQLTQADQVALVGYRTADGEWIQVVLPDNRLGWVDARGRTRSDRPTTCWILQTLARLDVLSIWQIDQRLLRQVLGSRPVHHQAPQLLGPQVPKVLFTHT